MPRGAPKGNFNALVHGRASPRVRALLYEARQENSENKNNSLAAFQASQKAQRRRRTESTKRPPSSCRTRREQL